MNKIVVGKPAAQLDVANTGLVSFTDLGAWTAKAYSELGWYAGVMLWQYRSDTSGLSIAAATQGIVNSYTKSGLPLNPPMMAAPQITSDTPVVVPKNRVNYPVRFSWIRHIPNWEPTDQLLASLAVPGYAK